MQCLFCSKTIRAGRSDKKFCDMNCKDAYHNEQKIVEAAEIRKINLILKKNRRILKQLFKPASPEQNYSRELLLKEGFQFGFQTHVVVTKRLAYEIVFCYDYGFREMGPGLYQLFRSFAEVQVKDGDRVKL
jgi:hypothetical protein